MKVKNKNNLIQIYKIKPKNYINPSNNKTTQLKNSFLKYNKNKNSTSFISSKEKLKDESKISSNENGVKRNQLIFPLINNITHYNQSVLNFSMNNIIQKSLQLSPIKKNKIKIGKKMSKTKLEKVKNLNKVYKESLLMKKKLKKFQEKKVKNMNHFSYKNYNYNLIKYSSINLSRESCTSFKKNMESIENSYNGQKIIKKDRWLSFLDKIGDCVSEGLKKKLRALSESKYKYDLKKTYNSK